VLRGNRKGSTSLIASAKKSTVPEKKKALKGWKEGYNTSPCCPGEKSPDPQEGKDHELHLGNKWEDVPAPLPQINSDQDKEEPKPGERGDCEMLDQYDRSRDYRYRV